MWYIDGRSGWVDGVGGWLDVPVEDALEAVRSGHLGHLGGVGFDQETEGGEDAHAVFRGDLLLFWGKGWVGGWVGDWTMADGKESSPTARELNTHPPTHPPTLSTVPPSWP